LTASKNIRILWKYFHS